MRRRWCVMTELMGKTEEGAKAVEKMNRSPGK